MTLVRGSNPIWFEVDLTAHAFDDTFYLFILQNEIPYIPATVWQDPFADVEWTGPIRFFANGTLPNNIYYDPNTVYRLEFRQGPTQSDPLIYLVENYVPGSSGNTPINDVAFSTTNQITNPQFALINFTSPRTLTSVSSQVINIAPGWFLNLTGSGNVTLTQVLLNSAVADPSNASYALQIQLSGSWTNVYLSQRFSQNGVLWSNTWVSSNIMALSGNAPQSISAILVDSLGNTIADVLASVPLTETFNNYTGSDFVAASVDTDFPPTAYIEYQLKLPNNCNITISSIQLISSDVDVEYPYEQTTIERQIDQTFHISKPLLEYKPIPSFLVGWDFPMNPAQLPFNSTYGSISPTSTGANGAYYAWDQTIIFQTVDSSISVSRSNIPAMQVQAVTGTQFALIQYLEASKAMEIIFEAFMTGLSVNVRCESTVAQTLTVSLWRTNTSPLPTLPSSIVTGLDANGYPTVASGWTEITRGTLGKAQFTTTGGVQDFGFSNFKTALATDSQAAAFFAIVVGSNAILSPNVFQFCSISLVPGNIPTIPAPQTRDAVMRECSRYYQKSFATNVSPGQAAGLPNAAASLQVAGAGAVGILGPLVTFPVEMRATPTVALYNPIVTSTQIRNATAGLDWSSSLPTNIGNKGFETVGTTPAGTVGTQGAYVHWTATAQLGVV